MSPLDDALRHLRKLSGAPQCWSCECLHASLGAIETIVSGMQASEELRNALAEVQSRAAAKSHGCLGCPVCYPSAALNALSRQASGIAIAPTPRAGETVEARAGWPPLAGEYRVLRLRAPVAICTLTDKSLQDQLVTEAGPEVAIVGGLHTENLGIERLILNVVANPHIRVLVLCGADSREVVGHLPGQSLLALAKFGVDQRQRIVCAKGQRPLLPNIDMGAIQHFRENVKVIDLIGSAEVYDVLSVSLTESRHADGPAKPYEGASLIAPTKGYVPEHMTPDPKGYVVVYVEARQGLLVAEHYTSEGIIDAVIEGGTAQEAYSPLIEHGFVSRLDHAAYLGRELARAERALRSNEPYVQDSAPEARS